MDENLGGHLKRRLKYVEITKSSDVEMERLAGDLKIQNLGHRTEIKSVL